MARIEDLIEHVQDPSLRADLQSEVRSLKRERRFGLVFEQHEPEITILPGFLIEIDSLVIDKTQIESPIYQVTAIHGGTADIRELANGQATRTLDVNNLIAVKRFGEPIVPTLRPLGSLCRGGNEKPFHAVINGDNLHALRLLSYLYEGQVDCIYIDPPFNTGARDWRYNNRYIDAADTWRHSKWLAFMERRLVLARRLLKPDGVLICAIDEHEVFHLGMLLETIFPDYIRQMITIVINPKGTGKLNFARVDEYAIYCIPNIGTSIIAGPPRNGAAIDEVDDNEEDDEDDDELDDESFAELDAQQALPFPRKELPLWEKRHARRRGGESSYRHQRQNQFYPIYIDAAAGKVVRAGEPLLGGAPPDLAIEEGLTPIWPIDNEGNERCWRFVSSTMNELIDQGRVVVGKRNPDRPTWTLNIWERRPPTTKLKTVWWQSAHDAGTHGTTLLHRLLGRRGAFPFPKSVYAVRDALAAVVRDRKQALIVDFFAGSGTTFHATCLLNQSDGGTRRTVLVTNNEVDSRTAARLYKEGHYVTDPEYERHGIFEQATRPRCEAVVTGRRPDGTPIPGSHIEGPPFADGLPENVAFYSLGFLDPDEVGVGWHFEKILPLLWLKSGAKGPCPSGPLLDGKFILQNASFAVLFDEAQARAFGRELSSRPDITHAFFVTASPEAYAEMASMLGPSIQTSMLYGDYLRTFVSKSRG